MTLTRTNVGTDGQGRPRWHYTSDGQVVVTGPVVGIVTTSDGTPYDVSEPVIEVAPEHEGEVAHLIGVKLEADGHPDHTADVPFVHSCTDDCGALARSEPTDG